MQKGMIAVHIVQKNPAFEQIIGYSLTVTAADTKARLEKPASQAIT
jgi:hypothetical protein